MKKEGVQENYRPQPEALGMLEFNADEYMEYLSDLNLTDAEKVEFLQVLWNIMSAFVNFGWGVDSVIPLLAIKASEASGNALQEVYPTPSFNATASGEAGEGKA